MGCCLLACSSRHAQHVVCLFSELKTEYSMYMCMYIGVCTYVCSMYMCMHICVYVCAYVYVCVLGWMLAGFVIMIPGLEIQEELSKFMS